MFDHVQAPPNLPVEPEAKQPPQPKSPMPVSTSKPPVAMRGGIMQAAQHEPEDILSSVGSESTAESPEEMIMTMEGGPSNGDRKLKIIMIVLASIAGILLLAVGGLFVYRKFFAKNTTTLPVTSPTTTTIPAVNPDISNVEPSTNTSPSEVNPQTSPVVSPTPTPDIPAPQPVGATSTSDVDTDGDGLSDVREAALHTDPKNADTDGDGLSDGEEVTLGTDPLVSDTDGDGLSDGEEVRVWKTDPKNVDTDGDTFSDGEEVRNGYNPLGQGKLSPIR